MDIERLNRWIRASYATALIEPAMLFQIQGLGKIDAVLFSKDLMFREIRDENNTDSVDWMDLNDSITLSYLWVLGSYEIIRTLNERFGEKDKSSPHYIKSLDLKKLFARLRVPLAKFEPEKRHSSTDAKVAYPALNSTHGIAWQISAEHFVPRGELSEAFISFMEWLRNSQGS